MRPFPPTSEDRPHRVAIVGGGPGGLFTAWHLEQLADRPLAITIFEASDRLGGKLLTPRFTAAPVQYEAGAAEFYDYSPVDEDPLRELVASLGLPTVAMGGSSVYLGGRRIANLDDLADAFGTESRERLTAFDAWARGAITPKEFYESGSDLAACGAPAERFHESLDRLGRDELRRYLETMIHSDLATEPEATSAGYGLQNYLMNDPAYMRLSYIAGGNEQLITAIASRLAAELRLESAVTQVGGEPGGPLEIAWQSAAGEHREAFDQVVVALPMDCLRRLPFEPGPLAEAMARHCRQHDHPADYLRITILFDRPLPPVPGDDSYLMLDALGGGCLYIESGREPDAPLGVLGWLLGGEAARSLADRGDEDLVAAALETLPPELAPLAGHVLEARVHRWPGAVSSLPGGWQPLSLDERHRPAAATHPNLLVVGDYLYDTTLNGVLDSAEHAAGCLAAMWGRDPTTPSGPRER